MGSALLGAKWKGITECPGLWAQVGSGRAVLETAVRSSPSVGAWQQSVWSFCCAHSLSLYFYPVLSSGYERI